MVWLVQVRKYLTKNDVISQGQRIHRVLSERIFSTEMDAREFYEMQRLALRCCGAYEEYVSSPVRLESYELSKYFCDYCREGFNNEAYCGIDGNFCSRACFRNSFQEKNSDVENYEEE